MYEIHNDHSPQRANAKEGLTEAQKRKWWNNRMAIDDRLRILMQRIQNDVLGPLASFFLGGHCSEELEQTLSSGAQELSELHDVEDGLEPLLVQLALYGMLPSFNTESLLTAVRRIVVDRNLFLEVAFLIKRINQRLPVLIFRNNRMRGRTGSCTSLMRIREAGLLT